MSEDRCPARPEFSYRKNKDGTIDSICMFCFLTVCSRSTTNLDSCADAEREHRCNPDSLTRLKKESLDLSSSPQGRCVMSGLTVTSIRIDHWRHRALQILHEIGTLESERQKPLPLNGPDSPAEIDDVAIAKIRELRTELKDIQSQLIRATYDDAS